MLTKRMSLACIVSLLMLMIVAAQCGTPATVVVTKEVEKVVKETVVVEKVITREVVVTPAPEVVTFPAVPPSPEFRDPDVYKIALFDEAESFDPAWSYDLVGMAVLMNVYDTMVFFKRDKAEEFVPQLASEWKVSEDGLTYQFDIRKGVKFHEGGTLEPHDIAYSLQRVMLQDRLDGPAPLFVGPLFGVSTISDLAIKNYAEAKSISPDSAAYKELTFDKVDAAALKKTCEMVQAAVKADDATGSVTIKLSHVTPWFLQILAQPWGAALDEEWMVEKGDWDGKCDNWIKGHDPRVEDSVLYEKSNGTGPYKLEEWKHGEEIVLTANENYWRTEPIWDGGPSGPPKIKRVVINLLSGDWGARLAMLHSGEADYAAVPETFYGQVDPLVKNIYMGGDEKNENKPGPGNTLKEFRNLAVPYITAALFNYNINTANGNPYIGSGQLDGSGIPPDFFSDVHVRKAFNYCFDWESFFQEGLNGNAIQARGPIAGGLPGYDEKSPVYSYNRAKCEEEFKASQWKSKDGRSLWDTGFYLQIVYNSGNEPRRIAAEILKRNLATVNPKFNVTVVNLPWSSYSAGQVQSLFPVFLAGWGENYHDPSDWINGFMASDGGGYSRAQMFPDDLRKGIDDLADQGLTTKDGAKREEIYRKLQQISYEQAVDIFIYQTVRREHFQDWIHGFYFNPLYPKNGFSYVYALSKSR